MIKLNHKSDCCGCHACSLICPQQCITMKEDEESFLYPQIDTNKCIKCKLCEKICPVINTPKKKEILSAYASRNLNDHIVQKSSSGGIFSALAITTINQNGVVFGAKFDSQWQIIHDYTENKEELVSFYGSKYAQSRLGDIFHQVKKYLEQKRKVIFTGTPCQIAGLKSFLRTDDKNLLTVDVICHGVPSPKIWKQYLQELLRTQNIHISELQNIQFRDKIEGWKNYQFSITYLKQDMVKKYQITHHHNLFLQGFIKNLYLRPSCAECPFKGGKSDSDITLGDFWGIEHFYRNLDDDKGQSLVLVHTIKGEEIISHLQDITLLPVNSKECLQYNKSYWDNPIPSPYRQAFFYKIDNEKNIFQTIKKYTQESISHKIFKRIIKIIKPE